MNSPLHHGVDDVIRIPVAGPKPFNTLAYIQFAATPLVDQIQPVPTGHVGRMTTTSPSPLVITGFDPSDVRQQHVEHSSTAVLTSLEANDDNSFTAAVDSIEMDADIDETGRVLFTWHWASQLESEGWLRHIVRISSWVLLYESRRSSPGVQRQDAIARHVASASGSKSDTDHLDSGSAP